MSVKQTVSFDLEVDVESFSDFLLIVVIDTCCPNVGKAFSSSRANGADSMNVEGINSSLSLFFRFNRRCCCLV
jgi:hypothetical protein